MDEDAVKRLIGQKRWYHRYEVVPGIWSPGQLTIEPAQILDQLGVPGDLTGMRALDIGAWDGPYTFELERRGAAVTALDIQDPDHTGFNVTRTIRQSQADYVCGSIYDLPARFERAFDIVLFFGVYYHLKYPLLAFRKVWSALKADGVVHFSGAVLDHADRVDPFWQERSELLATLIDLPISYFVKGKYAQRDPSCWFVPTVACLRDWLEASGFGRITIDVDWPSSTSFGQARKDARFVEFEHGLV